VQVNKKITTVAIALMVPLAACNRDGSHAARIPKGATDLTPALGSAKAGTTLKLASGDTMSVSDATLKFYASRGNKAAWTDDDGLTDDGEAVYSAIASASQDGLDPALYHYGTAQKIASSASQSAGSLADLDLVLTEGITRYANDLAQGAIDPKSENLDWRIPRERAPEQGVLNALSTGATASDVLAALRPKGNHYLRFMQALKQYRDVEKAGGWGTVPTDLSVKAGAAAPGVTSLRNRLMKSPDPTEARLAKTGSARPDYFDKDLQQALAHFQDRHAIEPDGALGARTIHELNETAQSRADELALNMDRWRWLPHDLGNRYILVNVAGFEMEVDENDKTILAMNVVVGQNNWKTPIFADTMENMVVNPSWNVPQSIMDAEISPAMARDPNYLASHNMELTAQGTARQLPGDDNALGQFKFNFPNKDNIYLHDTPAKSLFSRTARNFSHGCIRLENARALADLLMVKAAHQDSTELNGMLASGQERWVKFQDKWPVYILYFTAFVKDDGTVRFHHDVYGRDEKLQDDKVGKVT
jgi:murein L,D-transpeptidase YcbB/YkuD